MASLHEQAHEFAAVVAHAVNRVLPEGFRGRIEISVDGHGVRPYDVAVHFRPPQPRGPMK